MNSRRSTRSSKSSRGTGRRDRGALEQRRLRASRLFAKGMRPGEVAREPGYRGVWYHARQEEGVRGLRQAERTGRPRVLTATELGMVERQFVFVLSGEGEVEVSDAVRRGAPGAVFLVEDTTGNGPQHSRHRRRGRSIGDPGSCGRKFHRQRQSVETHADVLDLMERKVLIVRTVPKQFDCFTDLKWIERIDPLTFDVQRLSRHSEDSTKKHQGRTARQKPHSAPNPT